MGAALQFSLMAAALENRQGFVFGPSQCGISFARQMQAEPLAGQSLTIFQAGIADIAHRNASSPRQASRGLLRVEVALFHPEPKMLAGTRQGDIEHLVDLEILRHSLEHRGATGPAVRRWAEQLIFGHALTSSATACTAMPSSRPVKPSFSVVVALTLT
jgi:hypothetical protein